MTYCRSIFGGCSFSYCTFFSIFCFAMEVPIDNFSITPYSQNINEIISPTDHDYSTSLLKSEYQASQLHAFYLHYFSSDSNALSPWSGEMVTSVLIYVKDTESKQLEEYNNQNLPVSQHHYAENFKEHDEHWFNRIKLNMNLDGIETQYNEKNRAIAVNNTFARNLPDMAPDFFHMSIPGQGFPFDNIQDSAIWAGTPLYILNISADKAWVLALTPDGYFSWIKSQDVAYASEGFITQWQTAAQKGLIAITETETPVMNQMQQFQFSGYIGSVFPLAGNDTNTTSILIPSKNEQQQAVIQVGIVNKNAGRLMPLAASKKNIASIIKQLQNRPYGWGGAFFFNDCSQELKSLFTPFGIWLPRNTSQQAKLNSTVDLSEKKLDERLQILKETAHSLMTIIYINGHVMLYVGNKKINNEMEAMTYQDVWGVSPASNDKRYVIGQSLFIPLLKYYPSTPDARSPADKPLFKLVYLDKLGEKTDSPMTFVNRLFNTATPSLSAQREQ